MMYDRFRFESEEEEQERFIRAVLKSARALCFAWFLAGCATGAIVLGIIIAINRGLS